MAGYRVPHLTAAALLAALGACAGAERLASPPADEARVRLLEDSVALTLDISQRLTAVRTDAEGRAAPGRLQWRTGDAAVAVVDPEGIVTASGLGRTWIEVSDGRRSDTAIVSTSVRFRSIHAGESITCALAVGGQALCWGWNAFGSLGDGPGLDRISPALVDGGRRFTALSVGSGSVCGLAGGLYCWGYNGVGQLGDGTIAPRAWPVRVADTLDLASITLGSGTTTCAFEQRAPTDLTGPSRSAPARSLLCWGWNGHDQMLDGGGVNPHKPKRVDTGLALASVTPGGHHVCALDGGGAAWCWGRNDAGQLGGGSAAAPASPVAVGGGHLFTVLAAGITHSCGRESSGRVWCWGSNARGQLGLAAPGGAVPALAAGGLAFDTIVSAADHSCALAAGVAWCWGDNSAGQLGHGGDGAPAPVAGGLRFRSISTGRSHSCGIAEDGYAWCWGANARGELGAAAAADGYSPVRVGGQ